MRETDVTAKSAITPNDRYEEEKTQEASEYTEVKIIHVGKELPDEYALATEADANKIIEISKLKEYICEELAKHYAKCVSLRNGYLQEFHREGGQQCIMKAFKKYRPNLQYKLIYRAKKRTKKEQSLQGNEDYVLALCYIADSRPSKKFAEEMDKLFEEHSKLSELMITGRMHAFILNRLTATSEEETTILHMFMVVGYGHIVPMLLGANGLMTPPEKKDVPPGSGNDKDDDQLHRREIAQFLSRQDSHGFPSLYYLFVAAVIDGRGFRTDHEAVRQDVQKLMRLYIDFCCNTIDDDGDPNSNSPPSSTPFINRLLSIQTRLEGRTLLTVLMEEIRDGSKTTEEVNVIRAILSGVLDAMQLELVRQGKKRNSNKVVAMAEFEQGGGLDVSWLLVADQGELGFTPLHYKCKRLVQILPPMYLRPHNFFRLCTAKDSLTGGTPLHGLDSEAHAHFCSSLASLFRQIQVFDHERELRLLHRSSSSSPNNIAINILSSASSPPSSNSTSTPTPSHFDFHPTPPSTTPPPSSVHALPNAAATDDFLHAILHTRDRDGRTPLHTATGRDCINALLRFGASVAEPDGDGIDALTAAFESLFSQATRSGVSSELEKNQVLDPEAEGRQRREESNTEEEELSPETMSGSVSSELEKQQVMDPEAEAGREESKEEKELEMLKSVKVMHRTCDSLLDWACPIPGTTKERMERVPIMAETGVPAALLNKRIGRLGLTALHVAAGIGSSRRVAKLLEKGAHVNVRCSGGRTPLHMATSQGLSRLLAFNGVARWSSSSSDDEFSPLLVVQHLTFFTPADKKKFLPQWKMNLQLGLMLKSDYEKDIRQEFQTRLREFINVQDFSGQTCLHNLLGSFAGKEGWQKDVSEILKYCIQTVGCNVDLGNRAGETLLHVAVARCKTAKMVEDIIEWAYGSSNIGAPPPAAAAAAAERKRWWLLMGNASEETALHVAVRQKRAEMVELLLQEAVKSWGSVEQMVSSVDEQGLTAEYLLLQSGSQTMKEAIARYRNAIPPPSVGHTTVRPAADPEALLLPPSGQHRLRLVTGPEQHQNGWLDLQRKLSDEPTLTDSLDRLQLVMGIVDLLLNPLTSTPITIGILGNWGAGKTSFMRQVEAYLLVLNTPEQEREIVRDGRTVDVSYQNFMTYKAKAFLIGTNMGLGPPRMPVSIITLCYKAWQYLLSKTVNLFVKHRPIVQDPPRMPVSIVTLCYKAWQYLLFKTVNLFVKHPPIVQDPPRMPVSIVTLCYKAWQYLLFKTVNLFVKHPPIVQDQPVMHVSIVTIWYNAWQYDGKNEASAGLALEVCKELEDLMTDSQWLRMCCAHSWQKNRKGILMSLFIPIIVSMVLIILVITITKVTSIPIAYATPMGVLGVIGFLFKQTATIAQPVTRTMLASMSTPDYSSMLGCQHKVIKDIQFLQDQLCTTSQFPWNVIDPFWESRYLMKGTKLRKQCPNRNNLRIIIFMDDIDRCEEKTVLELLRAVNIIVNACGISVVLGANEQIIHDAIIREFSKVENAATIATETTQKFALGGDGKHDLKARGYDLAERFLQKIMQIPVRIIEPGNTELQAFVQGILTRANGETKAIGHTNGVTKASIDTKGGGKDSGDAMGETTKDSGDAKGKTTKDSSDATGETTKEFGDVKGKTTKDSGDAKGEATKDSSYAEGETNYSIVVEPNTTENAVSIEVQSLRDSKSPAPTHVKGETDDSIDARGEAVSPNKYATATRGIIYNTPTENKILHSLVPLTHGDQRLPREWKRFMNYHQLARSVIIENQLIASEGGDKFKGWRKQLILWIFVCWNWKTEMNIIIQEWIDLMHEMKRQLANEKEKLLLGDVIGHYMEKMEWKDKHEFYPIKVKESKAGDLEILAWVNLYNILREHFDIPFTFINIFQRFRYDCNPLHLSIDWKSSC